MLRLFFEMMHKGGGVLMWTIFFVSVVIWVIGFGKLLDLMRIERARKRFLDLSQITNTQGSARTGRKEFDDLLSNLAGLTSGDHQRFVSVFREFLITMVPRINKGFTTMTAWISVAPLLGLLGTVMGMIATFDIITNFGVGNPTLTAEGISVALLSTQAGLTVAFPGVIFQSLLQTKKSMIVSRIIKDGEDLLTKYGKQPEESEPKGDAGAV